MAVEWLVDVGHTRIKWVAVIDGVMSPETSAGFASLDRHDTLLAALGENPGGRVWLAATGPADSIFGELTRSGYRVETITCGDRPAAVMPAYTTLGVDRWLAMLGAWVHARRAWCVVDLGSAVTIDIVDSQGVHRGGWIGAGLETAAGGLSRRAPGLPSFDRNLADAEPALASPASVASGFVLQQAGLIERCWRQAALLLDESPELILTGGDADTVQSLLDIPSRRDEWLVFKGLLSIIDGTE